ncbi:hypothetical protein Mgra_00001464, partial [Meloidogyne graminicola]
YSINYNFGQISKYPPNECVKITNSIFELEKRKWLEKREELFLNKKIKKEEEEENNNNKIIIKRRKSRAERVELLEKQLKEINKIIMKEGNLNKNKRKGKEENDEINQNEEEFELFKQKHLKLKNIIKATKNQQINMKK